MIIINTEEAVQGGRQNPYKLPSHLCVPMLTALLPAPLRPLERLSTQHPHSVLFHSRPASPKKSGITGGLPYFPPSQTALLASIPLSPPDSFSKAKNELLG